MFKELKFYTKDQTIGFVGCAHRGHDKDFLWSKRGYKNVQEHDDDFVKRWNNKLDNNSIGFLLGDSLFGHNGMERLIVFFRLLRFKTLYVMPGNHKAGFLDLFYKISNNSNFVQTDIYGRIELNLGDKIVYLVPNYYEIYVDNQAIVLSHYPINCFNSYAKGSWCIHSHVHGNLTESLPTGRVNKILDVGLESVKEVQTFQEIKLIMDQKPIVAKDHHTKTTANPF